VTVTLPGVGSGLFRSRIHRGGAAMSVKGFHTSDAMPTLFLEIPASFLVAVNPDA